MSIKIKTHSYSITCFTQSTTFIWYALCMLTFPSRDHLSLFSVRQWFLWWLHAHTIGHSIWLAVLRNLQLFSVVRINHRADLKLYLRTKSERHLYSANVYRMLTKPKHRPEEERQSDLRTYNNCVCIIPGLLEHVYVRGETSTACGNLGQYCVHISNTPYTRHLFRI